MDKEIKNNIFYRPDIQVERDYSSTGTFTKGTSIPEISSEPITELQKLYEDAKQNEENFVKIKKVIEALPEMVAKILDPVNDFLFLQTELELNEINSLIIQDEQDREHKTYEETYTSEEETSHVNADEENVYVDDEGFIWGELETPDINITVVKAKSNAEQAQQQYLQDSTDLKEEYLMQINNAIEEYVYPLTVYMSEIGISMKSYLDQEYDSPCITGVPADSKHLHDSITRNDVVMKEIGLLMNKTHSSYKLINTFTAWDVASQQRVRYYSEEYQPEFTTYLEVKKNDLLTENRHAYDDKYATAKVNAYKFLYSLVALTKLICGKDLESKAAKCYLMSKNVNIYQTKKYDIIKVSNSATKGVAGTVTSAPGTTGGTTTAGSAATATGTTTSTATGTAASTGKNTSGTSTSNKTSGTNSSAASKKTTGGITGILSGIAKAVGKKTSTVSSTKAKTTTTSTKISNKTDSSKANTLNLSNMLNGCFGSVKLK